MQLNAKTAGTEIGKQKEKNLCELYECTCEWTRVQCTAGDGCVCFTMSEYLCCQQESEVFPGGSTAGQDNTALESYLDMGISDYLRTLAGTPYCHIPHK